MGIAAFIPAKMTSKRLTSKNMRPLCGKPLLYYAIRVAQLTDEIDTIVISSEDPEVLAYARSMGVEAVARDPTLSEPNATNLEVLRHWYAKCSEPYELVVLLQPTHPLRLPDEIGKAIRQIRADPTADCLFAVLPDFSVTGRVEGGYFVSDTSFPKDRGPDDRRCRNTGSFYIFRPSRSFMAGGHFGSTIAAYMLQHPHLDVDVNFEHDLIHAEALVKAFHHHLAMYF